MPMPQRATIALAAGAIGVVYKTCSKEALLGPFAARDNEPQSVPVFGVPVLGEAPLQQRLYGGPKDFKALQAVGGPVRGHPV